MKVKLYAVKDELAGNFNLPKAFPTEEFAQRWFRSFIKEDQLRTDNAADFSLWYLGEYDLEEGQIEAPVTPNLIERGQKNG